VAANSTFKVGDIVVPTAGILKIVPYWEGAKFKITRLYSHNALLQIIESSPSSVKVNEVLWLTNWIKLDTSVPNTSVSNECSCELQIIMIKGCQCGGE